MSDIEYKSQKIITVAYQLCFQMQHSAILPALILPGNLQGLPPFRLLVRAIE